MNAMDLVARAYAEAVKVANREVPAYAAATDHDNPAHEAWLAAYDRAFASYVLRTNA